MNELKICALPIDVVWGDIEENLFDTEKCLRTIEKGTDIVVLPELFTTGFITSPELLRRIAEDVDNSPTVSKIKQWAKSFGFAISGSLLVRKDDKVYNRAFFIEPSGESTFYDKKHLFSMSSEATNLTAGNSPIPIIRFRGWNVAMAVCYEVRFPVWLRNTENRYDILLIPANWPASRTYAWKHLLIARAIENQAYVIGVNRTGKDDGGTYDGKTFIVDYLGRIMSSCDAESPTPVSAVLNRDALLRYRNSFPVIRDADHFTLL